MPCQVGMTTDPGRRKHQWQYEYPKLRNWEILGRFSTKSEAQAAEYRYAAQYGGNSGAGGAGPEKGDWVVYKFDY